MTDVFGVAATGIELIPPRQMMARISYDFWLIKSSYNLYFMIIKII
jgi:hypothetical protein